MASDSRARLIAYLSQAGLSTARANAVLDNYAHEIAKETRAELDTQLATPRELALRQRAAWITAGRCPMCGEPGTGGHLCLDCTGTVRSMRPRERREWRRYEPPTTAAPIQSHGYTPAGLLGVGLDDTAEPS